jgi:eukaryotic-like serine/threonine-protein kinase
LRPEPSRLAILLRRPRGRAARLAYDIGQLVVGLLVGVLLFDRIVMPRVVRQGWDTTVPDLRGSERDAGETLLRQARLRTGQVLEVPDPDALAGKIISQDPPAGARVRRGRLVHLLVSQGAPIHQVPDLVGKTVRAARLDLVQNGMQQGAILVLPSDAVPEGDVIGTHPQRGAAPHRDGSVDLLVSGGEQRLLYLMPDLRGMESEDAAARLRAVGIQVDPSSEAAGRFVSAQTPEPGEPIASGQFVSLN